VDEKRYWSVRDACWLPSPRPLSPLETPWSLHARPCPPPQPRPTPEQDLRWLRLPPVRGAGRLLPGQRRGDNDNDSEHTGCGPDPAPGQAPAPPATSSARPVSGVPSRRT
jgi:hypothetical protein